MVTGRRAFDGDDASDVLATVLKGEPDWTSLSSDVPPHIRLLIRRCLEKDPRKRAGDIAVARFLMDEPVTVPAPAIPAARTRRWIPVIGVSSLLVLAIAGAVALTIALTTHAPKPMRFTIASSSAAPFEPYGSDRDIAVSPDGRRIVYRALVNGTPKLVVHDVNELDARVLDGTDGARSPFVSSDGQWIGFSTGAALKKVSITGGAPVTICRTLGPVRGGSWYADTIVFATNDPTTGLLSVSAAGGEATVLTKPDRAAGEGDHLFPSLLRDGRRILFTIASGSGPAAMKVAVLDLETKERKVVVAGGTQAQYVDGAGAIVFANAGTLRAARFDPSRAQLLGEPVSVLERVATQFGGSANYVVSRDGMLVYVPASAAAGGAPRRALVWVGRDGREEMLPGDARPFTSPRLSPDERQVLVHLPVDSDDIWTLDVSRGALSRQTFDPAEDETPVWMPDGKTIAYASIRSSTPRAIHRRRADGVGAEEVLWTGSAHAHVEAPTPDGRAIVVASTGVQGGQFDLMLLPLDGDRALKPLIQTPFNEHSGRVSPDGRWIAYASDETGRDEVYVRAFPSLEGKTQISTAGGSQPVWSKRGDELFFRGSGAMMAVRIGPGAAPSVGQPQKLFENRYYARGGDTGYDVSRDGRFLMVKDLSTAQRIAPAAPASLIVVLNWFEELKAKLPR